MRERVVDEAFPRRDPPYPLEEPLGRGVLVDVALGVGLVRAPQEPGFARGDQDEQRAARVRAAGARHFRGGHQTR
ncbi:hypothetical protein AS594_24045 [Streptomyces agglomeratus]|uniref:Uncharacterized protein n=1 Tax=Streptomyces agglomeratus TaxID=285458 RepID=A0A1E5PC18_9ACTN|nr:hypothetical protein AS594_24045 [Streptomyces agglomeratus]